MESFYTLIIFLILIGIFGVPYWIKAVRHRKIAEEARSKSEKAGLHEPATLHPRIDILQCIGCASCVRVCPEDVLGIVDGHAAVINGLHCVGHAVCTEVCPVGAITMGFGKPKEGMEIPVYDQHYMTNVQGLYIVGELGGVGLIRNAFEQSKNAIAHIAAYRKKTTAEYDVVMVGGGPAGIGGALAAKLHNLNYMVLEQYDLGGAVLHYPRQKIVLTSPVELPLYGKLKYTEIAKEQLLALFKEFVDQFKLNIKTNQKVEEITVTGDYFKIRTGTDTYTAQNVVLALGRRGTPRKLGVPGEDLPKVYYRLIEAEHYQSKNLLIVGGGDSAIEAAVGLARQKGNKVTMSYRRDSFVRLKEKNEQRINELIKKGHITVIFNSQVEEIKKDLVKIKGVDGNSIDIPNDFVFVFAGGEMPAEFLKKIGVNLRTEESGS
ncbi:MAG: NAD(P)-binding domain-containing protein [Bacteroidota bacterium]